MKKRWIITALCLFILGGKSFAEEGSGAVTADMTVTTFITVEPEWITTGTPTISFGEVPAGTNPGEAIELYITHNTGPDPMSLTANVTKTSGVDWLGTVTLGFGDNLIWQQSDFGTDKTFITPIIPIASGTFIADPILAEFQVIPGQAASAYSFQIEFTVTSP